MSREPVAASVLVMLMGRSPRASWWPPMFRRPLPWVAWWPLFRTTAPRDADSWSFLPLLLQQRAPPSHRGQGGGHGPPTLSTSWPGQGWVGAAGGAGRSSSGRSRCAPSSSAAAARMPLRESPS